MTSKTSDYVLSMNSMDIVGNHTGGFAQLHEAKQPIYNMDSAKLALYWVKSDSMRPRQGRKHV